jgi:hypothetical protein
MTSSNRCSRSKSSQNKRIAVIDLETDPFKHGRVPQAFAAGFYDGRRFVHFWGAQCVAELMTFLRSVREPLAIFAHNGGRFDFFYLLPYLENPLKIIAGRIVTAKLGRHELRDSFAILPVPLATYEKDDIDYAWFEPERREKHRVQIVDYLRTDCVSLYDLVTRFESQFGRRLTTASTAMKELAELVPVNKQGAVNDRRFRPFYFGGRVECFESGILRDDWIIADVNSMYPFAMRDFEHPCGGEYTVDTRADVDNPRLAFAQLDATSRGAFPLRAKDGSLSFPSGREIFNVTAHEWRAARDLGMVDVHKVKCAYFSESFTNFRPFVDRFMQDKIAAEASGDKAGRIFAKLMLNSAYGKFAQRPDAFTDFQIRRPDDPMLPMPWDLYSMHDELEIWSRPSAAADWAYFDVCIGASITGAARSLLLRALAGADRPIYCDTDSIICRGMGDARIDKSALGAWKIEAHADMAAIAGKKLYACKLGPEFVKYASKGVQMDPQIIVDVAAGHVYKYIRDAPSYTLRTFGHKFIQREIRATT